MRIRVGVGLAGAVGLLGSLVVCQGPAPPPAPPSAPPTAAVAPAVGCVPPTTWSPAAELVKSPLAEPAEPSLVEARAVLAEVVLAHARDPANPWAVAHGMLALGPDLELTNGALAVDHLLAEYAEPAPHGIGFPRKRGPIRIEPHTDLLLKAFTEGGLLPDRPARVAGRPTTLGALHANSVCKAWIAGDQVSFDSWNDTPWALQGLAAWATPGLTWVADGHPMSMDTFTHAVVARLEAETEFLRQARAAGATVQKKRQGIFGYTCGGAHLLQGAAYAVARGFGEPSDRARIADQVGLLVWRVPIELGAVDQALAQAPEYTDLLLVQRLKFLGHLLESVHKIAALGLVDPDRGDPFDRGAVRAARSELVATVAKLQAAGVLERIEAIRATNEQLYLDIVGDSAHAVRGIDLATGVAGILR